MQFKQYKELVNREHKLQQDMQDFILGAIKANGGRITYVSPDADEDELSLDDKYPVISTLWGAYDKYNIAITDVYSAENGNGQVEICADGIEQETETPEKDFLVYPEQFSDVIHFITAPLREGMHDYAAKLALKDLVEKHGKLPSGFKDEYGRIKDEYREEHSAYLSKHRLRIEELMEKCEASSGADKDDIRSGIMELAGELSTISLVEENNSLDSDMMYEENGCFRYREKYQDEFNGMYDRTETELNKFFDLGVDMD